MKNVVKKIRNAIALIIHGEITKYDANGKLIHEKSSEEDEAFREYNANGKLIHYKNANGYELWNEYDSKGNLIHYKDSDGDEWRTKYTYKKIKGKYLIEWELSN